MTDLISHRRKLIVSLTLVAALMASLVACAEYRSTLRSCAPFNDPHSRFGSFTVQQRGAGASIQYGMYPNAKYAGTSYYLAVTIAGRRGAYDVKRQNYPPHGSVDAKTATRYRGHILSLKGTVERGGKLTLAYQIECTIAR